MKEKEKVKKQEKREERREIDTGCQSMLKVDMYKKIFLVN